MSQFKLDLKERATASEIKREPAQSAAGDLLPNESHATAYVSLLPCLQKLSATLTEYVSWNLKLNIDKHKDPKTPVQEIFYKTQKAHWT